MVIIKAERRSVAPQMDAADALPLTPAVFHIMLALADGDSHGYGIMQEVDALTGGQLRLGPGTLYRSIQRMAVDGYIEELPLKLDSEHDDERRRYYRLTPLGLATARAEAARLAALVDAAAQRKLLGRNRRGTR
ncbi:MAG TPA: PadR family transcriptional regulator [Gemmatimonadaceae bacterium]|nr:PadR family transcriptional regulator [Gemmatimonadaceae bacterium]